MKKNYILIVILILTTVAFANHGKDNTLSVRNKLKSASLKKQLLNMDANERILQVEISNGLILDVESGQYLAQRLEQAKDIIPGFKLIITDANGSILKTY